MKKGLLTSDFHEIFLVDLMIFRVIHWKKWTQASTMSDFSTFQFPADLTNMSFSAACLMCTKQLNVGFQWNAKPTEDAWFLAHFQRIEKGLYWKDYSWIIQGCFAIKFVYHWILPINLFLVIKIIAQPSTILSRSFEMIMDH
jgi:hypothetical protein